MTETTNTSNPTAEIAALCDAADHEGYARLAVDDVRALTEGATLESLGAYAIPPWLPPRRGDVVLDSDGNAWQFGGEVDDLDSNLAWHCASGDCETLTAGLLDSYGPLTLIARDGKRCGS